MLSVLKSILDVGISFTPTGDFLKAAKAAVQGAKTFSENGLEVGSFFGNWVGPACGKQDWNFDVEGVGYAGRKDDTRPNEYLERSMSAQGETAEHKSGGLGGSMMDIHKATKSMTEWTCGATANTGLDGGATETWGVAAVKTLAKKEEHWVWPWANGWVPRVLRVDTKGKPKLDRYGHEMADGCDRDEWPPRNFWPGDDVAHPKGMTQRVRFNPFQHNRGAGNLWGNFCPKHDAVSTKGNKKGKKTYYVRDYLISTVKEKVQVITGKDKTMTRITTVSVQTPRAIFSIDDWDGLRKDTDWYGLKENPCWPKDLVPDDPGWVLNTADEFYSQGQHPDLAKHTKSYRGLPDLQVLKNALAKHGGSPPHPFSKVDLNVWDTKKRIKMGDKEGEIPKEYRGVLPGNPKPKKRRMLFEESRRDNGTDFEQDDEPLDEDEDEGAFDEWENWKEYERLLRRAHFELASRTTPQRTEAEATPAGQGDATPTPAAQGSAVANQWPLPTN
ncbi:hypothetical protein CGCSCA1_v000668 [Colletotrichum siamense]|nr:hypothetical protein CGCSCA1_v000668 [Colletotrichum siamense]